VLLNSSQVLGARKGVVLVDAAFNMHGNAMFEIDDDMTSPCHEVDK
jgi:hypothetical protein